MVKEIQFRRGSTTDHISGVGFTGALAEVTVDTTNRTLRVHDGSTKGGHELVGVAATQRITNKDIEAINLNVTGITTVVSIAATQLNVSSASTFGQTTFNGSSVFKSNIIAEQNLEVYGNITVGGTTVTLNTQQLQIVDPDIVLGIGTTFSPTDSTANHGGIAIASTEGTPLVNLNIVPAETNPATYKKIMWFKSGTATGLNTDAWLFNYGVGIGSTQIPNGVRFASGDIQFTQNDISVVRSINASGIVTAPILGGTNLSYSGISTFTNGPVLIGSATSTGTASQALQVTGGGYFSENTGIGSTNPTAELHIQGTGSAAASSAPLKISVASPTLLTTPESGAFEYDRVLLYHTNDDTTNANRRALIPEIQFIRRPDSLSINDTTSPGTSFFGATNRPALLGGYIYEIEAVVFITKVTNAGTVTVQASLSTGNFTFATLQASTASNAIVVGGTTSPVTIFTSASLTAGTSHGITIKGLVQPVSNSRFDLLALSSTATITALANSYMKVTCVGTGTTIGNFG